MKSLDNAKEARIYASYETARKVLRELFVDFKGTQRQFSGKYLFGRRFEF